MYPYLALRLRIPILLWCFGRQSWVLTQENAVLDHISSSRAASSILLCKVQFSGAACMQKQSCGHHSMGGVGNFLNSRLTSHATAGYEGCEIRRTGTSASRPNLRNLARPDNSVALPSSHAYEK